jgi:hypothetical protein
MKNFLIKKFPSVIAVIGAIILTAGFTFRVSGQTRVRSEINIPDIPGYLTLKCDFHMHTIFSDGNVWPTVRAAEAWQEGLHAFSITDHIETRYHSYKEDIKLDYERPSEAALPAAEALGLLFIKGGEITRDMPPGHTNAIFLKDVAALNTEAFKDAINAAAGQGAFIFYNHPGWKGQQKDGMSRWYPEHTEIYRKGQLHGIEIVNGPEYYPDAHQWCIDKKLTMIGNSDVHDPMGMNYEFHKGEHRTMTLVFAKKKTINSIKEALFARRTAIYWENSLVGESEYLEPIFSNSIEILNPEVSIKGKSRVYIQIRNTSIIPYELELAGKVEHITVPEKIVLYGNKVVIFRIRGISEEMAGTKDFSIPYVVKNLLIAPGKGLPVHIEIKVHFSPVKK